MLRNYAPGADLRKGVFTVFTLLLLITAHGQGQSGTKGNKPPSPPGKGGRSDNHTPHPHGMILNDDRVATFLTPTGWGSTGKFGFVTTGGTPNQLYGSKPDMVIRLGAGIGDYRKIASLVAILNINDASQLKNYSCSFIASRSLGKWGSLSAGALHLLRNRTISDGTPSLYLAWSRDFNKFGYTLGAGTGNFATRSPYDVQAGMGRRATAVFGSLTYKPMRNWMVAAEWTGSNLAATTSYVLPKKWPVIYLGVTDLTRYSGDSPTFVFGIGKVIGLGK
jgi:hypothetical protein